MTNHPTIPDQDPAGRYPGDQQPYGTPDPAAPPAYGPPSYGPPAYGPPAYFQDSTGYGPQTVGVKVAGPQGLSLASMIVGLTSLIFVGALVVPQVIGLVLGILGIQKESPQGRGFAVAGIITNGLALLIYVALWAFGLFFFAALMGSMESEFTSSV